MNSKRLMPSVVVALAGFLPQSDAALTGTAESFAVLGGTTVTSTGNTVLNGDLGVSPGTTISGFGPGIVHGTIHTADGVAAQARADAIKAYDILKGETATRDLAGQDLGGLALSPGVYSFSATSAQLTGTLILDAGGKSDARFDFQIGSTLTTAAGSLVSLVNGAQADHVFWQVGSSATLGANTAFYGTMLADQSITLNSGASMLGGALALKGAVTLNDNRVTAVPEPGTYLAGLSALSLLGLFGWKNRQPARSAEPV